MTAAAAPRRYVVASMATREIVLTTPRCTPGQAAVLAQPGEVLIEAEVGDQTTHYASADGTALVAYTEAERQRKAIWPAGGFMRWSNTVRDWIDPRGLAEIKAAKNDEINTWWAEADRGTFTYAGRTFQADDDSQKRIVNVALVVAGTGALPPNFPGFWKAADNTEVSIPDVATWASFHGAMVAQGTANFATSGALKAALASATTAEAVAAIVWPPPT